MSLQTEREELLIWIDRERDGLVDFVACSLRSTRPNHPGDTRNATAALFASLAKAALPARTSAPKVAVFEGTPRGRQLMLNGPVDVCIPRLGTDARPLRRRGAFTHATTVPHLAMPNEPSDLGAVKLQALSAREYPSGGA